VLTGIYFVPIRYTLFGFLSFERNGPQGKLNKRGKKCNKHKKVQWYQTMVYFLYKNFPFAPLPRRGQGGGAMSSLSKKEKYDKVGSIYQTKEKILIDLLGRSIITRLGMSFSLFTYLDTTAVKQGTPGARGEKRELKGQI